MILGIETSCDETAAAVVEEGCTVKSNVLFSQEDIHGPYGGIVPELACRRHVDVIDLVVERALEAAGVLPSDLSAIAVTQGPGFMGALLVGISFAKAMAYRHQKPLIGINHLEGHMAAISLEPDQFKEIPFPLIGLVVSGGHTNLYMASSLTDYTLIGKTMDDAAGEAFDKGSMMLGLGFPGGPVIDQIAKKGDPSAIRFPRPSLAKKTHNFSFSGLKTALRYYLQKQGKLSASHLADIAAGFQQAIVDVLVAKCLTAMNQYKAEGLVVSGGVAANSLLRKTLENRLKGTGRILAIPKPSYCTDNGAMIAAAAFRRYQQKPKSLTRSYLSLSAHSRLPIS